jgi:hypothetical protein
MRGQSMAIAATVVLMLALALVAAAADPIIGNWKLNIAKSKFPSPESTPKELTEIYREIEGNQIELTRTTTLPDGSSRSLKDSWPCQGGIAKPLEGDAAGSSYVQTLIAPGNWYVTHLQDGKQVAIRHKTLSKDGKIMIHILKGIYQGRPYERTEVFDKQ